MKNNEKKMTEEGEFLYNLYKKEEEYINSNKKEEASTIRKQIDTFIFNDLIKIHNSVSKK